MQSFWLQRKAHNHLVIFFNGWGMDHHPFLRLASHEMDVLMLYDYRDLHLPPDWQKTIAIYPSLSVIAWSMGVWASQAVVPGLPIPPSLALAINGTLCPIHAHYGIPPEIYAQQINHFTPHLLETFYGQLCHTPEVLEAFLSMRPQRPWQEQQEELLRIQQQIAIASIEPAHYFDFALISRKDKIMPAHHQLRFWKQHGNYRVLPEGHFPFLRWSTWNAILSEVPHG